MTPYYDIRIKQLLLSDSRVLSSNSTKTIFNILSFVDLIDPISFIGNPFTSQPIYIAACVFLMETSANPSRENPPPPRNRRHVDTIMTASSKRSRHSLLVSVAKQNYQRCCSFLQQIHAYWKGVEYILTALDVKSKWTRNCEPYVPDEHKTPGVAEDFGHLLQSAPIIGEPRIAPSQAATPYPPTSNLTLRTATLGATMMAHLIMVYMTDKT
jgi:hypothetical protein